MLTSVLLSLPAPHAAGAEAEFPKRRRVGEHELMLVGEGIQRFLGFLPLCAAGLYLPAGTAAEDILNDIPRRLEIEYFQSVRADQFAKLTTQTIRKNVSKRQLAGLEDKIDRLNELYEDVKPGDRYALAYDPETGTELSLNGVRKGVIEGAEFAHAAFSIWLGEKPVGPKLKDHILRDLRKYPATGQKR